MLQHLRTPLREAGPPPRGPAPVSPSPRLARAAYVGRTAEMAELAKIMSDAAPSLTCITGDGGIGKSRLMSEAMRAARRSGGVWLADRCCIADSLPFSGVIRLLRGAVEQAHRQDQSDVLAASLPTLGRLDAELLPAGAALRAPLWNPRAERVRVLEAMAHALVNLAATTPLCLSVDDLHLANEDTLAMLRHLLHEMGSARQLRLVLAWRPGGNAAGAALRELCFETGVAVHDLPLRPLDETAVARLTASMLRPRALALRCRHDGRGLGWSGAQVAPDLAAWLGRVSAGRPFLLGETVRALADVGGFELVDGQWRSKRPPGRLERSCDAERTVLRRVRRIDTLGRRVLDLLAVCTGPVPLSLLATALGHTVAEVRGAARGLRLRHIVVSASHDGLEAFDLAHDSYRSALYGALKPATRAHLHRDIAAALLPHAGLLLPAIHHLDSARTRGPESDYGELAALHLQAAQRLSAAAAHATALRHVAQAEALMPEGAWSTDYDHMASLASLRASALFALGDTAAARAAADGLLRHAVDAFDAAAAMRLALMCSRGNDPALSEQGCRIANELGARLPRLATPWQDQAAYAMLQRRIRAKVGERPLATLADLPVMTDLRATALQRLLSALTTVHDGDPWSLGPIATCRQVTLNLRYGNGPSCGLDYVRYARLLVAQGRHTLAGKFGALGMSLLDRTQEDLHGALMFCHAAYVRPATEVYKNGDAFAAARRAAMDVGDMDHAAQCVLYDIGYGVLGGASLDDLRSRAELAQRSPEVRARPKVLRRLAGQLETIAHLTNAPPQPAHFNLLADDHEEPIMLLSWFILATIYRMPVGKSLSRGRALKRLLDACAGTTYKSCATFYAAMSWLVGLRQRGSAAGRNALLLNVARAKWRLDNWQREGLPGLESRALLVAAEWQRVVGRTALAAGLYDAAAAAADRANQVPEAALAYELGAETHILLQQRSAADERLAQAAVRYTRWGAHAKRAAFDKFDRTTFLTAR